MDVTNFEALSFVEERRKGFFARHGIQLEVKLQNVGEVRSQWKVVGSVEAALPKVDEVQNRLASKASKLGLSALSNEELQDFMDVEEVWWFLNSGDTNEFVRSHAPTIAAIAAEVHSRGIVIDPSGMTI